VIEGFVQQHYLQKYKLGAWLNNLFIKKNEIMKIELQMYKDIFHLIFYKFNKLYLLINNMSKNNYVINTNKKT